jgi:hypothetical protein
MFTNFDIKVQNPVSFHNTRLKGWLTKYKIHKDFVIWEQVTFDYVPQEAIYYLIPSEYRSKEQPMYRISGNAKKLKKMLKKNSKNLYLLVHGYMHL